jgi:hypothetical protein
MGSQGVGLSVSEMCSLRKACVPAFPRSRSWPHVPRGLVGPSSASGATSADPRLVISMHAKTKGLEPLTIV